MWLSSPKLRIRSFPWLWYPCTESIHAGSSLVLLTDRAIKPFKSILSNSLDLLQIISGWHWLFCLHIAWLALFLPPACWIFSQVQGLIPPVFQSVNSSQQSESRYHNISWGSRKGSLDLPVNIEEAFCTGYNSPFLQNSRGLSSDI